MFVPHFSEYASRLSLAMARDAEVLVLVDARNFAVECDASLRESLRAETRLVTFDSSGRPARALALATTLAAIAAFRPEAVVVQEQVDSLTAWVCRLAGRLRPLVLTVHDPSPHSGLDARYVRDNAGNRRAIRAAARAFHVHGEYCRRQLATELAANATILVTAHGVILTPRPWQIRSPEPGRVLMFGRMEAYKGLSVLLDAADLLELRGRDFRLVIAGKGSETLRLGPRIAANPRIEWIDEFLAPERAITEFQRASIIAAPYVDATQSGVVSAAFGNGRPVVASNAGGLPDAVSAGVTGLLATPNDPAALADALEAMLADPALLDKLTSGARRAASADFAWAPISDALLALARALSDPNHARRHPPGPGGAT